MAYSYNGWKRMSVGNREVHHGISLQWVETDVGRKQGSSSWHIAIMGGNGCQVGNRDVHHGI